MSETTLTELEQREIRMYIRDSVGGADIDTDRLPRWLAHLVEAERERDQLRAERDALKDDAEWLAAELAGHIDLDRYICEYCNREADTTTEGHAEDCVYAAMMAKHIGEGEG